MRLIVCTEESIVGTIELDFISKWSSMEWDKSEEDDKGRTVSWSGINVIRDWGTCKSSDSSTRKLLCQKSKMTEEEMIELAGGAGHTFYAWHLSDFRFLEKELSTLSFSDSWKRVGDQVYIKLYLDEILEFVKGSRTILITNTAPEEYISFDKPFGRDKV